jgi:hypothetical protein
MDPVKKMDCRASGEVIWKCENRSNPVSIKYPLSRELMLLTTTVKGKTLCSMNRPLINSMP